MSLLLQSSFRALCDWGNCFQNTSFALICFILKGKLFILWNCFFVVVVVFCLFFFFNQSYLEVAPLKNGRQTFIQRDLDRLEKQADRNLIKLFKDKFEAQSLGKNKSKHTEGCLAGKELGRKGSGGPGGHHAEHESAMCTCCKEGHWYPGLH